MYKPNDLQPDISSTNQFLVVSPLKTFLRKSGNVFLGIIWRTLLIHSLICDQCCSFVAARFYAQGLHASLETDDRLVRSDHHQTSYRDYVIDTVFFFALKGCQHFGNVFRSLALQLRTVCIRVYSFWVICNNQLFTCAVMHYTCISTLKPISSQCIGFTFSAGSESKETWSRWSRWSSLDLFCGCAQPTGSFPQVPLFWALIIIIMFIMN